MNHGDARGEGDADDSDGDSDGECEGGLVALGWSPQTKLSQERGRLANYLLRLQLEQSSTRAGLEFTILLTHPEPWDYRCGPPHLVLYNAGTEPRLRVRARQALSQPSAWPPPPPPYNSLIVAVIYGVLPISK